MDILTAFARVFAVAVLMALASSAACQQTYPSKPIRFLVPYTPGGASNDLASFLSQKPNESWDQPVIVDNRPGGNTIIASEIAAKSPPDGYTILYNGSRGAAGPGIVLGPD